jgi:hypothetical protein
MDCAKLYNRFFFYWEKGDRVAATWQSHIICTTKVIGCCISQVMTTAQLLCTLTLPALFRNWTLHGAHKTKFFFCFKVTLIQYHLILCFSVLFPLTPWFYCVFVGWTFWQWDVNFTSKFRYYDNWPNCFLHRNVLVTLRGGISCEWWI